jgi:hypothetical protein
MTKTEDGARAATMLGKTVEITKLVKELTDSVENAMLYRGQMLRDYDTASALWPGQTDDGRQWDEFKGKGQAAPWDGAADTRQFLVDGLIGENVRICLAAWRAASLQASALRPVEGSGSAQTVTRLLRWMFDNHCKAMAERQLKIAARWQEQYGYAVMGVWWEERPRLTWKTLVLADMVESAKASAEQGDESNLAVMETLMDPVQDEQAEALLRGLSPILKPAGARKALRELRTKGETQIPDVEVFSSLPRWRALRPWVDVFFPAQMETVEETRWIARRQWLTEAQLRECALANGWDEKWLEDVCENARGKTFDDNPRQVMSQKIGQGVERAPWQNPAELKHLIEVVWYYQLGTHEEHMLPVMYLTVFCPMRPKNAREDEHYAFHGPMPDDHGEYPFIEFSREVTDHILAESRSIGQVGKQWQDELKHARDARINRADITTIPPLIVGSTLGKTPLQLGPGSQFPESRKDSIRWLNLPNQATDSAIVTQTTQVEVDTYFARVSDHVPSPLSQLALADKSASFLTNAGRCVTLSFQLAQQYLPDTTAQQIADDPTSIFHVTREDIRGQYAVKLTFNAQDLDFENSVKRIEAYKNLIIASDRTGAVNVPLFLEKASRMLDPDMAAGLIQAPEQAADAQRAKVRAAWTSILGGVDPEMPPVGNDDYQLQLSALEEILANPANADRLKAAPDSAMLFERFVKHLQFGVQQQQNQGTGLRGVKPIEWQQQQAPAALPVAQ